MRPYHLFERFGVELEYMIVRRSDLSVLPVSDKVIRAVAGDTLDEFPMGKVSWSNELVLHVFELKCTRPARSLEPLAKEFQKHIRRINRLLEPMDAMLLPTGAHPFMDPFTETRIWPHAYSAVYNAYDRIFGCRGHGWANIQSSHLNLPFSGDEEFGKLHAAARLVLPILPALSASTPVIDGKPTGFLDTRLEIYKGNQKKIPSIGGRIIPEKIYSKKEYQDRILSKTYKDIAPHDPEGVLQHEFLNSRGAIARFERNTIEIRVIDVQECPLADLAILALTAETLKSLVSEAWTSFESQKAFDVEPLAALFDRVIKDGPEAEIRDADYLKAFGCSVPAPCTAGNLWRHIRKTIASERPESIRAWEGALGTILDKGPLSRRIMNSLGSGFSREKLVEVYRGLAGCLDKGELYTGS
jgi:carboxylate-amine ligase